jgi:hypothetical protein
MAAAHLLLRELIRAMRADRPRSNRLMLRCCELPLDWPPHLLRTLRVRELRSKLSDAQLL